jgi:large subunit ribosomal protein L6
LLKFYKIMSRLGRKIINLPDGVKTSFNEGRVAISGPKGSLTLKIPRGISIEEDGKNLKVRALNKDLKTKAMHGTVRALVANMVKGVSEGWTKVLELVGTGFRAEASGKSITLNVGYSHPVKIDAPEGISFKVEKLEITVEGIDKELVGLIADKIRSVRPPEPYKGKGIKYKDEVVRRKAGKAAKTQGAAA